ncbi:MAG: transcriptional regulator [Pseudolabrys sp.]|jgi:predicted DNA-binding transcriptional regulator AlpA
MLSRREIAREPRRLIRFRDLRERGIVSNWPQLRRLVDTCGFPSGRYLGPNTRAWTEAEVDKWLAARPTNREELTA